MDAIPPKRAAHVQDIKKTVYPGGYRWGKMLESTMCNPSAEDWGWGDPHDWKPI